MTENGIDIKDYNMVQSDASLLASGQLKGSAVNGSSYGENDMNENSKVWIDSNSCCLALYSKLDQDQVLMLQSPIALPKAVKNPVELDGLRKAHIRDGAAVVQYLAWLDNQMQENYGASGYFSEAKGSQKKQHMEVKLTEVSVSDKLEGFRASKEAEEEARRGCVASGMELRKRSAMAAAAARDALLDELRALMAAHSPPLHALVVPSEDAHQSEYVSERDKRRQFISGFTGSAGLALITMKEALLWTDGRYFLQAEQQLSDRWKLMRMGEDPPVEVWIADHFKGLSFPTISSVGPNAAVIHYSPEASSCAELDADKIYLCDSGAQYLDGTTDITRTVHFGKPSEHEKSCYTAAMLLIFSHEHHFGEAVWTIGMAQAMELGPHLISFRPSARNVPLQASMTVTDEPGYYEDGSFGIRLENVLIVKEANTKYNFGDKGYLAFEHITWAPYQTKLIDTTLLTPVEIEWVNAYHADCRKILQPYLNEQEKEWLRKATEPIAVSCC
uniref:Peptidase M24 domain-containing protein n=1 Tax=Oryza glumipatula TaxID=40148 RepID=A0A0E0BJX0_9ORYZ